MPSWGHFWVVNLIFFLYLGIFSRLDNSPKRSIICYTVKFILFCVNWYDLIFFNFKPASSNSFMQKHVKMLIFCLAAMHFIDLLTLKKKLYNCVFITEIFNPWTCQIEVLQIKVNLNYIYKKKMNLCFTKIWLKLLNVKRRR